MAQNDQAKSAGSGAVAAARRSESFFTIRRRGQGKWTRIGTAIGASIIIFGAALFIYNDLGAAGNWNEKTKIISASVFAVLGFALAFWLQNSANNVTFLIDTDSEMKKVNWTSRQELIGSTRIVILFMLILSTMLFVVDLLFGAFFKMIGVLKISPFDF